MLHKRNRNWVSNRKQIQKQNERTLEALASLGNPPKPKEKLVVGWDTSGSTSTLVVFAQIGDQLFLKEYQRMVNAQ